MPVCLPSTNIFTSTSISNGYPIYPESLGNQAAGGLPNFVSVRTDFRQIDYSSANKEILTPYQL
jgi:hypothetical protein